MANGQTEFVDEITMEPIATALKMALVDIAELAMQRAIWWSSGKYKSTALAKPPWNHPYAQGKHGPYPYGDPGRINVQSGLFVSMWRMSPLRDRGFEYVIAIRNEAPYATDQEEGRFGIGGWIARPLPNRVIRDLNKTNKISRILLSNFRSFV